MLRKYPAITYKTLDDGTRVRLDGTIAQAAYLLQRRIYLESRSVAATNGCRIWTGPMTRQGHGTGYYFGRPQLVHRIAYEAFTQRAIPKGAEIRRTCGNKLCIEPSHLQLRTPE